MVIKFCGGCNPLYDRVSIANRMKQYELKIDILLLNGCHRGCKKGEKEKRNINVQEFFITHSSEEWREEKIIEWILEKNNRKE